MADSKITALTSIGASTDPANDPLVLVDVSDTSMAATGTTKKVTLNQLLGASGTATLASATITGGLTIGGATSFPAGVINTSGGNPVFAPTAATNFLYTGSTSLSIRNQANTQEIFNLTPAGVYTFGDGAGGTRMTLNSTGLGVGVSPSYKIHSAVTSGFAGAFRSSTAVAGGILCGNSLADLIVGVDASGNGRLTADTSKYLGLGSGGINDRVILDSSGNVGIGVTPSGKLEVQESGTGGGFGGIIASTATAGGNAGYVFRTGGTNRWAINLLGSAAAESLRFYDVNNSATRLLIDTSGNVISNVTGTAPTLATNSQMVFNLTSNTNLRISVRGTDGTTRTANITLA